MKYAIVDIETDGGVKITEISIFIFDGEQVVDEFTTLINPGTSIPPYITRLTGINNFMVKDAPKFEEVAKRIYQITEDCVFVAHNVNFDYGIIGKEFKSLGLTYRRKKLCSVRLSRKLLPGKRSYSLGKLCISEGIEIKARHRARGDAEATVILFKKLLSIDELNDFEVINSFLNPRSREATLPPLLPKNVFESLSEKHGVYYFWNKDKEVIYVGKANNIKQRVVSHFHDKKKREIEMCLATANITFTETGSELIALLEESAEIKRLFPKFNRAQRRTTTNFGLFSYKDRKGVMHLAWNNVKMISQPIMRFYTVSQARSFVENLCKEFQLCPKYCHLQTNVNSCFHYQIKECKGVCREEEAIEEYNKRVMQAIDSITFKTDNFVITEQGKTSDELSYALVINGVYEGYGYIDKNQQNNSTSEVYFERLKPQKDNQDIRRIINAHVKKNPASILPIEHKALGSLF
ncbi:DNA polymerase III subunit epsilon [Tenacibaculum sp. SZ-18]|uniref:exonuclease domain-containing protein n=1 Tax=Tenacibaculum sp. SZ-18 TaxID=754423 RepID=UPI000C2D53B3|nr:exonuclease domain-containing protein [Tenacibaculum sp. SZ-18]AUC16607.1 DNA polymerase III subunit epsilon [Tenacibaculum sp. SZ-18]